MSNPIHSFYFILVTLFWGGSFLGIKIAVDHYPPLLAASLRVFIALAGVTTYLLLRRGRIGRPKLWYESLLSGLFAMGFAWIFLFWGEQHISPALAAILNSTVPIFTILLTPFITPNDKLHWNQGLGVLIGFLGVGIIFMPEASWSMSLHLKGLIAILFMSVFYAIGVLWTRRLSTHIGNATHMFYQCLGAGPFLLLLSSIFELPHQTLHWSWPGTLALLYLGIGSSTIAWVLFFRLVKDVGSIQAAATTYCFPLVAVLLDLIFLKKGIQWNQAVGAGIILLSVFLINKKMPGPLLLKPSVLK